MNRLGRAGIVALIAVAVVAVTASTPIEAWSRTSPGARYPFVSHPRGLDFGSQQVGTVSDPMYIRVFNRSSHTLSVSSVETQGDFGLGDRDTCFGATLAPADTCVGSAVFVPPVPGEFRGQWALYDNAHRALIVVPLRGTGVAQFSWSVPHRPISA